MATRPRQGVQLDDETNRILNTLADTTGLGKGDIVRRLLQWLQSQDDVVRSAALGTLPESLRPDLARLLLERMARPETPLKWPVRGPEQEVAEGSPHYPAKNAGGKGAAPKAPGRKR